MELYKCDSRQKAILFLTELASHFAEVFYGDSWNIAPEIVFREKVYSPTLYNFREYEIPENKRR